MKHLITFLLIIVFFAGCKKNENPISPTEGEGDDTKVTYAGKTYNTIKIGEQIWLKENLDVGTMIQGSESQKENGTIEKYCYGNDPANCDKYGGLYQWNEAMQYSFIPGTKGICPTGWHIPTALELHTLSDAVGGNGNALKEVGQGTGSGVGTNTRGFSLLFAGIRHAGYGTFSELGKNAYVWSSEKLLYGDIAITKLEENTSDIKHILAGQSNALSVRCIKD